MIRIDRSVVRVVDSAALAQEVSQLAEFRSEHGYVLLGDPGLGKTTALQMEAKEEGVQVVRASDFIDRPQQEFSHDDVLFIDGLDETRSGIGPGGTPLSALRARLFALGRPRFRIACREADWLGESDRLNFQALLPSGQKLSALRLCPLNPGQVLELLTKNHGVEDAAAFVRKAEALGLDALLPNPQALGILAAAVAGGQWPQSRMQAYELACRELLRERNVHHQAVRKEWPSESELLDAAGLLAATQLCANLDAVGAGTDLRGRAFHPQELGSSRLPFMKVLSTSLFSAAGDANRFEFIHRSVAEFLAGRYLAGRIEQGASIQRILALMRGADGGVLSSLRGLHAWLAVHSRRVRADAIERDPLGVLQNSDCACFEVSEKRRLLQLIGDRWRASRDLQSLDWNKLSFRPLADERLSDDFAAVLQIPTRTTADRLLASMVVVAIHGSMLPALRSTLLGAVRDASWPTGVRTACLEKWLEAIGEEVAPALELLDQLRLGKVLDADDELTGLLLDRLYPRHLAIPAALTCLHKARNSNLIGSYRAFWHYQLLKRTAQEDLPALLEALHALSSAREGEGIREYWELAGAALVRGLEALGDLEHDEELLRWMEVGLDYRGVSHLSTGQKKLVTAWFEARPERYKALLAKAIRNVDARGSQLWRAEQHLHGVYLADGLGHFWLAMAGEVQQERLQVECLQNAVWDSRRSPSGSAPTLERIIRWSERYPDLKAPLAQMLEGPSEESQREQLDSDRQIELRNRQRIERFRTALDDRHVLEVDANAVFYLAWAWLDHLVEASGSEPEARLSDFLGGDPGLVRLAVLALDSTPSRSDLPNDRHVATEYAANRLVPLAPPLIVALDRLFDAKPAAFHRLSDAVLQAGLVSSFAYVDNSDPAWAMDLLRHRPGLFAAAYETYATAVIKAGRPFLHDAAQLAFNQDFACVAREVALRLLSRVSARATAEQASDFEYLLLAAIKYEADALKPLIERKSKLRGLNISQRVRWLAAGLMLAPEAYVHSLAECVRSNEVRLQHLGQFLQRCEAAERSAGDLPVHVVGSLIGLMGPYAKTSEAIAGWVTSAASIANLVQRWIARLAGRTEAGAQAELRRLAADRSLANWHEELARAEASQEVLLRDASYHYPSARDVARVLEKSGPPVNIADMAAIVNEELERLATEIAADATDSYVGFWNTDPSHGAPTESRHEERCRDHLMTLLGPRLQRYAIFCQTEVRMPDRKRADIWFFASGDLFGLPLEAKKQSGRDLWSAPTEQLAGRYSVEHRAQGYGIYLVFWFGTECVEPPSGGSRPASAAELRSMLVELLDERHRSLLSIHVLDLARRIPFKPRLAPDSHDAGA